MEKLPKQFKKAHKASVKQGWVWVKKTNHIEVRLPDGTFVTSISTTMYDGPLTRKVNGQLRKYNCPGL